MPDLRLLQEKDLESIYPIYVHYVKKSTAIFDLVPDSFDVFKKTYDGNFKDKSILCRT